jgi:ABC-type transport system substrate-binding protein
MVGFGAEGGVYASRFGELKTSDSGLETTMQLSPAAIRQGLRPDAIALQLIEEARATSPDRQDDFAAAFSELAIAEGRDVAVTWQRPHLHPEAYLRTPLRQVTTAAQSPGLWLDLRAEAANPAELRFQRTGAPEQSHGAPQTIIERIYPDDDAALAALQRGDIDAVDRVPPWQLDQISRAQGIVVAPYRLPTVHVLIPNMKNPLVEIREFRRAICYGTDRAQIVKDILLGGKARQGFTPISGPFPAGVSLNDPVGYANNPDLKPRPYEPRLAALLAGVARSTLAKRELAERKERGETVPEPDPGEEPKLPPPDPLILAHPADSLARVACQSIKLQLDSIGIPVKLVELPADDPSKSVEYDLLYAELVVTEPLFDARRILSSSGVAGRATALMASALDTLDRAENWNTARARLQEIHRIAHYDLPVIPLWQTVNYFARRKWLDGFGDETIVLYQNLDKWKKKFD